MHIKDDILPLVGMNKDDDPRHFEKGDYLEARNLNIGSNTDQGDQGLVHSLRSTLQLALPNTGTELSFQHLATAVDKENGLAYILTLVQRTSGPDTWDFIIFRHDISDNTFRIILNQDAETWGLYEWAMFQQEIHNPKIVDSNLIWTDNYNDIRMVNVDRMDKSYQIGLTGTAVKWDSATSVNPGYAVDDYIWDQDRVYVVIQNTSGAGGGVPSGLPLYYTDKADVNEVYLDVSDPSNFVLAALPSLIAPTAGYVPDTSVKINQLRGKTWQFTYRYIYMDYRKSTYAPPSLVPSPDKEESVLGVPNPDTTHNNRIKVYVNTGNEEVRSIEVIARSSEDPATWFLIDTVFIVNDKGWRNYAANTSIAVDFLNDKGRVAVDVVEVYTPFSYVPVRAKHMELVEGNRLVFGNITEGYSRITPLVGVDLSWESLSGITSQDTNMAWEPVHSSTLSGPGFLDWLIHFKVPSINPGACTFYLRIDQGDGFVETSFVYNGTDTYPSAVLIELTNGLNINWPGESEPCFSPDPYGFCGFPRNQNEYLPYPYRDWTIEYFYRQTVVFDVYKYPALKTGVTQSWGIVYRDKAGRLSPIIGSGEITKYIPFVTENTNSNVGARPQISFNINHNPPDWAESYEIVYSGNKSVSWFLQLLGYNFAPGKEQHDVALSADDNDHYRIRIKAQQENTRDYLNNWSVEEYVWQKGDRIRIIGKVDAAGALTEINDFIYDSEIVAVYTDTDQEKYIGEGSGGTDEYSDEWIYFKKNTDLPSFSPNVGASPNIHVDNLLVEIYRPFTTETGLFFTTGMTYPIKTDVYGDKLHGGDTDQVLNASGVSTSPAIVANTAHDGWKYIRNFRNVFDDDMFEIWSESEYPSDFYLTEKMDSRGNPIPDVDSQQQNVLTKRIRHGGKINIGSQINQIAKFDFDDYLDLKDEDGSIEGLRTVGFVLKVIQYKKVVSIYISRQESFTASGQAQYLFTDKVFGSSRPAMENWGTKHPGSVIVHNRNLYYWDQSEGIVVRDSANGQFAVSDYKMKRYFSDLAKTMDALSPENQRVKFAFSMETDELFCMFGDETTAKEIVVFRDKEGDQRWKQIIDLTMTFNQFYWIGKRLFTVYDNDVYEWWKGADYNSICGVIVRPSQIFYSNINPAKVKTFNAVIIYGSGDAAPNFFDVVDIIVPDAVSEGDHEMKTLCYPANIEKREGVYYCQILMDINTPGPGTEDEKLMNGDFMRGLYLRVHIQGQLTTDKYSLSNIIVVSTPSERSR